MGHKFKIGITLRKKGSKTSFLGFVNNATICCDVSDFEDVSSTAMNLASEYIDVDLNFVNIKKASFFSGNKKAPVMNAKTGEPLEGTGPITYLWFYFEISESVKTSEEINWISLSNFDEISQIPLYKNHLHSLIE